MSRRYLVECERKIYEMQDNHDGLCCGVWTEPKTVELHKVVFQCPECGKYFWGKRIRPWEV